MTEYHWVLTVSIATPGGEKRSTHHGFHTPREGYTRADSFNDILNLMRQEMDSEELIVLFFSLEPNRLEVV